jgi:hypothetical protein
MGRRSGCWNINKREKDVPQPIMDGGATMPQRNLAQN